MKRIFLIGYMGSGKSTLGRLLAKKCALSFIDLDAFIEQRYHQTVGDLFSERGEAQFRLIEQAMLHEVGAIENVVISTGGGAPCFFDNIDFMNREGLTIFLDTNTTALYNRLQHARNSRPLLAGKSDQEMMDFIETGVAARLPFYSQAKKRFVADQLCTASQIDASVKVLMDLVG